MNSAALRPRWASAGWPGARQVALTAAVGDSGPQQRPVTPIGFLRRSTDGADGSLGESAPAAARYRHRLPPPLDRWRGRALWRHTARFPDPPPGQTQQEMTSGSQMSPMLMTSGCVHKNAASGRRSSIQQHPSLPPKWTLQSSSSSSWW